MSLNKPTVAPPPKRIDGVSAVFLDSKVFAAKIEYLSQLRQIESKCLIESNTIQSRINGVCDSIEKDLNL
ncbi:hypothetical protein [Paenibacillus sp. sgz500958]|uniref:hypothetical protein n=1 Tax=Paenibacillus sp. sgz500958 TaxID=3242475 RepID=UPI0036D37B8C